MGTIKQSVEYTKRSNKPVRKLKKLNLKGLLKKYGKK